MNSYSVQLMEATKKSQSRSALAVLRAALAAILDIDEEENGQVSVSASSQLILRVWRVMF